MADAGHRETPPDLTQRPDDRNGRVPPSRSRQPRNEARRSSEMNRTFGKLFALVAIPSVFAVACGNSPSAPKKTLIGDILYSNDPYQPAQQQPTQAYPTILRPPLAFAHPP